MTIPSKKTSGRGRPRQTTTKYPRQFHIALTPELTKRWDTAKAQYETSMPYELSNSQFIAVLLNILENSLPEERHPSMITKIKLKEEITNA